MKKRAFPPVLPKGRTVCFRPAPAATLAAAKRRADAILRKKAND